MYKIVHIISYFVVPLYLTYHEPLGRNLFAKVFCCINPMCRWVSTLSSALRQFVNKSFYTVITNLLVLCAKLCAIVLDFPDLFSQITCR